MKAPKAPKARNVNVGEYRVINQLVNETEQLETAKKRGRKTGNVSLFWAIFENHFVKEGIEQSFVDEMAAFLKLSKPLVYTWNSAGFIPNKWRYRVVQFMEKYGIILPPGIKLDQLFAGGKNAETSKEEKSLFNSALYLHFDAVRNCLGHDLVVLHEQLSRGSKNLINLPLLMRWIFETGGISSTRVKAYMTALMGMPDLQKLIDSYGVNTVDEGVEYAHRHGWVAPFDKDK